MSDLSPTVYNDLASLGRLKAQSAEKPQEALQEVAKQFEALFVSMMIKAMRDTVPEDSMFGSSSMKNYQEMFDQQLSLDLSRKSGIGFADLIARQLSTGVNAVNTVKPESVQTEIVPGAAMLLNAPGNAAALDAYKMQLTPAQAFELKR